MHTSFLSHAGGRYLWIATVLIVICITAYLLDEPSEVPNGGTTLGYILGTLGAALIVWLAYLGKRKRNFAHGWGTVRGWVSAHVYLGSALIVVATLHTGFQFDWNIHTFAYGLMCLTIFSGIFGVYTYSALPSARNALKSSQSINDVFLQVEELDGQLNRLASDLSNEIRGVVSSAIERTAIGGGYRDQIFGRDHSLVMIDGKVESNKRQHAALDFLVEQMTLAQGEQSQRLAEIIRAFGTRQQRLVVIREDIRLHALIQIWLLFHVPVTFALVAALIAHVFAVFVYW